MGTENRRFRHTELFGGKSELKDAYCIDAKEVSVVDGKVIGEPIKRLGEYEDWEWQGRLFFAPVAIKQEVYKISKYAENPIIPMIVSHVGFELTYDMKEIRCVFRAREKKSRKEHIYFSNNIGKFVFLTEKAALEALIGWS